MIVTTGGRGKQILRSADFDVIEHHAFFERHKFGFGIELLANLCRHFPIEGMVLRCEDAALHQFLDHVGHFDVELFGEFTDSDAFGQGHLAEFPWALQLSG